MDQVMKCGRTVDVPIRNVLNSGERSARDLRDEWKMQSNTTEGFPAVGRGTGEMKLVIESWEDAPLSVSKRGWDTMTGTNHCKA